MKRCPECERTYSDETLTFCLADGSLLSAPYAPPQLMVASPRLKSSTEVIPAHLLPKVPKVKRSAGAKYVAVGLLCLLIGAGVVIFFNPVKNPSQSSVLGVNANQASSTSSILSPTDTLKAYYKAAKDKDIPGLKKYLSQGTLKIMEVGAKNMGKNLDDVLKDSASTTPPITPLFGNEKVTGDTATVDINADGQTIVMPFVKEGGEWKIAMDKLVENMQSKS